MGEKSFSLDKEKKIINYLLRGGLPVIVIAVSFKKFLVRQIKHRYDKALDIIYGAAGKKL